MISIREVKKRLKSERKLEPYASFNVKQLAYARRATNSWFNVAEGGKRAGKNVLNVLTLASLLEHHPDTIHLLGGVSNSTARLNIIDNNGYGLARYFKGRCWFGDYEGRDALYVKTKKGYKVLLIAGGEKKGYDAKIKGNTYGMVYITEANECHPDFVREAFDRTLSSQKRVIFHDVNPKGDGHWYYEEILNFHAKQQSEINDYGYNYEHFTIADNMSISQEQLNERLSKYDKKSIWYKRDILGRRIQAEGLVYTMFDPAKHVQEYDQFPPRDMIKDWYISIDYGSQNPFSAGLWGYERILDKYYRYKEYYYNGRAANRVLTDSQYADKIDELSKNVPQTYDPYTNSLKKAVVIIDPSAASMIQELRNRGYPVQLADNSVEDGIRTVSQFLMDGKIIIHISCKDTIKEFGLYSWDNRKNRNNSKDIVVKEHDHAMDDVRYFIYTVATKDRLYNSFFSIEPEERRY